MDSTEDIIEFAYELPNGARSDWYSTPEEAEAQRTRARQELEKAGAADQALTLWRRTRTVRISEPVLIDELTVWINPKKDKDEPPVEEPTPPAIVLPEFDEEFFDDSDLVQTDETTKDTK